MTEGPNANDQIAFYAFHPFLVKVQTRETKRMLETISTQSSSVHVEERDRELWGTLEQGCLSLALAKNNKSVSDWSIQVCTRAVERAACLACDGGFP